MLELSALLNPGYNQVEKGTNVETIPFTPTKNDLTDSHCDIILGERNLETLGFFSASTKRNPRKAKSISDLTRTIEMERVIDGKRVKAKIKYIGTGEYGLPIIADLDIYRAFQKICTDIYNQVGKLENPISFTTAEIRNALERKKGGRIYEEVNLWLGIMKFTGIIGEAAVYDASKEKWINSEEIIGGVSVFDKFLIKGQKKSDGSKIAKHYVWLSDWYMNNFMHQYYKYVDYDLHKSLNKPIAKILYPILDKMFYASEYADKRAYKRYSDLCNILGIKQYIYLSDIKRFLEPTFKELQGKAYLLKWEFEEAQSGQDYVIHYWPGKRYFDFHTRDGMLIDLSPTQPKALEQTAPSQEKPKRIKQSQAKSDIAATEEDPALDTQKQPFVAFLKKHKVHQAERIICNSPHSSEMMEIIKKDFEKKLAEKFQFTSSPQAWLRSAFVNQNFQKPKDIKTDMEIQEAIRRKNEADNAWRKPHIDYNEQEEYRKQYIEPIIEQYKKENPNGWEILYQMQTEEFLQEGGGWLKEQYDDDPNRVLLKEAITGKCVRILRDTLKFLSFEEWKEKNTRNKK
jgi:hypothetical protein